jgi:Bacteriophage head to tail connecting protein
VPNTQIGPGHGGIPGSHNYKYTPIGDNDLELRKRMEARLLGLRVNRYSWWTHWRELADYILPRRYKWLITPNQMARGSPINQHILDCTPTLSARDLAAGIMFGVSDPARPWFRFKIGQIDSTQTSPTSLWLAQVERMMRMILAESNFYTALAIYYLDLVIFGTAVMLIYEDFENCISCVNPCLGEYYLENNSQLTVDTAMREFTLTISQVVDQFGLNNVSDNTARLYKEGGSNWTREIIVGHAIEPNVDPTFGIPKSFKFREAYWEWTGSAAPQGGSPNSQGFLRKKGFHEQPFAATRWDIVSNDAYGRGPGMDALGDVKQLQLEQKRKAQAIDKMVNPPLVADIQLKNQPASLLPGGMTYIAGMTSNSRPGMAPVYTVEPKLQDMAVDIQQTQERIKETFYNSLFKTISQYETRSNVSATEIDARRAESSVMLGPVLQRVNTEGLDPMLERVFGIANRAGLIPPAPPEVHGRWIKIEYSSMIQTAQAAAATGGIERLLSLAGNLAGVDPQAVDNIDIDYAVEKYSSLLNNDPRMIRSPQQLANIRNRRQKQEEAANQAQQADTAQKLAMGAKTLSETGMGGGQNTLQALTQGGA